MEKQQLIMDANSRKKTWHILPEFIRKRQAQHILKLVNYQVHEVGKLKVFQFQNHTQVINEESLVVHFFDTVTEAMNFCLDNIEQTKIAAQGNLFN
jgi:hypothetical protein